jgi:hypothetical protein
MSIEAAQFTCRWTLERISFNYESEVLDQIDEGLT